MTSNVRRAARFLIRAYGGNAAAVARKRAHNLRRDALGSALTWQAIAEAIEELETCRKP